MQNPPSAGISYSKNIAVTLTWTMSGTNGFIPFGFSKSDSQAILEKDMFFLSNVWQKSKACVYEWRRSKMCGNQVLLPLKHLPISISCKQFWKCVNKNLKKENWDI